MQTTDKQCNNRGGKSLHSQWKEYVFGDEFDIQSTGSGIDKNKLVQGGGETPYVTRTDMNNGIDSFIGQQAANYKIDEGNVITIGLDTQTVFYQPKPFYTGQNIQVIRHKRLDRHNAMFLIVAIKKLVEKFSWGSYGATLTRLKKSRIYLPADEAGEIDFPFMTAFMQDVERDILSATLKHFKARAIVKESEMGGVKWQVFDFNEIFRICKGFYNKKPTCNESGDIPFIGASDSNNGFTGFTDYQTIETSSKTGHGVNEPIERKLFSGGAICVTNNGSVGYAYYQPHQFTCTHDVNPLYLRHGTLNRYTAMFLIRCIEQQRVCFAYARKWRPKRMVKSKLKLPIDSEGKPDWAYMESHMRRIESRQILAYLETIKR